MASHLRNPPLPAAHRGFWAAIILALASGEMFANGVYPAEVATIELGHGTRLTDARGFTLYQYENDLREPGTSTCTHDCAARRPPLLVTDLSQEIPENWSVIDRNDGSQQWAYRGMPLYRYARDSHQGVAFGEGYGWAIAFEPIITPSEMTVASTVLGHVLASSSGQTLYFYDRGEASELFECNGECLETWLPFQAPWGAIDHEELSVKSNDSGVYQWAYREKPLYLYSRDSSRGDTNGEGVDGVWKAMILEPSPPAPEWTTIVRSDGGALYGDSDGMTLHAFYADQNDTEEQYRGGNHCDEACLARYWNPLQADGNVAPIGHWSVIENGDGTLQWAYKGRRLYTSKLETRPGQLYYTTFRQFQWMKPIMYSLPALQGVF